MIPYLRDPVWDDVVYLAENLRDRDVEELESTGLTPFQALSEGFKLSKPCFTLLSAKGEAVGMMGVGPGHGNFGAIWMLGAKGIEEYPMTLLKNSRKALQTLWDQTEYQGFFNYVYSKNQLHIDWLKWLGFTFLRTVQIGPYNRDFIEFVKLRG